MNATSNGIRGDADGIGNKSTGRRALRSTDAPKMVGEGMVRLKTRSGIVLLAGLVVLTFALKGRALAADPVAEAKKTVAQYKKTDPGLSQFFDKAAGYVVFSNIGKGAAGIGGAFGKGVLFEKGNAMGHATLTQVTVGAQLGGQSYSEVIFFETGQALASFKEGKFFLAAQVSAVALKSGASANAKYSDGVAVLTATKAGLMAEASLGGQKFTYEALGERK